MSDDQQMVKLALEEPFVKALVEAIKEHGEGAVYFSWQQFLSPMLPFAANVMRTQELVAQATANGLGPGDTGHALKLYARLKKADDRHEAWLAAELIIATVPAGGLELLLAAIGPAGGRG